MTSWVFTAVEAAVKEAKENGKPFSEGGLIGLAALTMTGGTILGIVSIPFDIIGAGVGAVAEAVSPGSTKDWEK